MEQIEISVSRVGFFADGDETMLAVLRRDPFTQIAYTLERWDVDFRHEHKPMDALRQVIWDLKNGTHTNSD